MQRFAITTDIRFCNLQIHMKLTSKLCHFRYLSRPLSENWWQVFIPWFAFIKTYKCICLDDNVSFSENCRISSCLLNLSDQWIPNNNTRLFFSDSDIYFNNIKIKHCFDIQIWWRICMTVWAPTFQFIIASWMFFVENKYFLT